MSIYSSLGSLYRSRFGRADYAGVLTGGLFTDPRKSIPNDVYFYNKYLAPEVPGTLDVAGFNAAKAYELQRLEERNLQADKFAEQSDAFNVQMAQQAQASGTFFERVGQLDERLASIKAGMPTAASKVSSIREYSQLSKRIMENTSRYLSELERFKAPSAPEIDFTFKNPITGESLELGTQFSDVFSDDYSASAAAREMIVSDFQRLSKEKEAEAMAAFTEKVGLAENYGTNQYFIDKFYSGGTNYSPVLGSIQEAQRRSVAENIEKTLAFESQFGEAITGAQRSYLNNWALALQAEDVSSQYGEAAALAQLGGYTDWIDIQHVTSSGGTSSGSLDPIAMFYGQDANAVLEDYIAKTADRLEISRLGDVAALQAEFERRQQNAQSQYQMYQNQQARNQQQAQRVEAEKQRTRQELERQKAEYAQSLGAFGAGSVNQGDGIEFTDTRPQ